MVSLKQLSCGMYVCLTALFLSSVCSLLNCAKCSDDIPPECIECVDNNIYSVINGTCGMHINICRVCLTIFTELVCLFMCLHYSVVLFCTHNIVCKDDCKKPTSGDEEGPGTLIGRQDL